MCDRVGVLYAGRLVEEGPVGTVLQDPRHPYTVGLLRCIPRGGVRKDKGRLDTIPGFLPSLGAEIPGCVFADRCALADDRCRTEEPALDRARRRATARAATTRTGRRTSRARRPRTSRFPAIDRTARAVAARSTTSGRSSSSAGKTCMRSSASAPRSGRARPSGSSASPAAARRPSPERCSGSSPPTTGSVELEGSRARADVPEALARRSPLDPDRVPESRFGAQPASLGAAHPAALDEEARRRHRLGRRRACSRARRAGFGSPSAR